MSRVQPVDDEVQFQIGDQPIRIESEESKKVVGSLLTLQAKDPDCFLRVGVADGHITYVLFQRLR